MRLQGIIFDVDGVIVETENIHRMAYNETLRQAGINVEWSPADYAAMLRQVGGQKLRPVVEASGVEDVDAHVKQLHDEKRVIYKHMLDDLGAAGALRPKPGVVRLIGEATDHGVRLGLATVSPRQGVQKLLTYALGPELLARFDALVTGYDVKHTKPAPDVYVCAASKIGVDPARTVAIEDSQHGLESAKGAGLKVIVTPSEYTKDGEFSGYDLLVPDLDHLAKDRQVDLAALEEVIGSE